MQQIWLKKKNDFFLFLCLLLRQILTLIIKKSIIFYVSIVRGEIMYNDKIFLTPKEILDKEFKIDARGYRPQEVDKFLDMVIRDYSEFLSTIKRQEKEIHDLNDDNLKLKQEIRRLKMTIEAAEGDANGTSKNISNVDMLRRISQLEKIVFGKDE
jgi:DivIVA domain-containing protein